VNIFIETMILAVAEKPRPMRLLAESLLWIQKWNIILLWKWELSVDLIIIKNLMLVSKSQLFFLNYYVI